MSRNVATSRNAASARSVTALRNPATYSAVFVSRTGNYVLVPNIVALQAFAAFTFEAFIYMDAPVNAGNFAYVWAGAAANSGFNIRITAANLLQAQVGNGTTTTTGTGAEIPRNKWVHVAVSYNGSGIRTFIDGVVNGSVAAMTGTTGNPAVNYGIGNFTGSATGGLFGKISEVRISNTARYIGNFTPTSTPFVTDANTVGLYHFFENSGTVASDASSQANNGTLTGTFPPTWTAGKLIGTTSTRVAA